MYKYIFIVVLLFVSNTAFAYTEIVTSPSDVVMVSDGTEPFDPLEFNVTKDSTSVDLGGMGIIQSVNATNLFSNIPAGQDYPNDVIAIVSQDSIAACSALTYSACIAAGGVDIARYQLHDYQLPFDEQSSSTVQTVDNPTLDLFLGVILVYTLFFGIVWFFGRRKAS